jgi:hypothetical protein
VSMSPDPRRGFGVLARHGSKAIACHGKAAAWTPELGVYLVGPVPLHGISLTYGPQRIADSTVR